MNSNQLNKNIIGDLGEQLVKDYFKGQLTLSENKYDSVKDGIIDNLIVEIKTLQLMRKFDEYFLAPDQFNKVTNVDVLIVVDIPLYEYEGIKIQLVTNNKCLNIMKRFIKNEVNLVIVIPKKQLLVLHTEFLDSRISQIVKASDELSPFRQKLKGLL